MLVSLFGGRGPRAEGDDRSPWGNFWFEPVGLRSMGGPRVSSLTAMGLPAVWACVQVLAKSFALMPVMVYEPQETGVRKKRRDHWLYRLLKKRPNKFQTAFEWRQMLMGHLALRGNAFCQITANARGEITDLLPLHPDRMQCE
ncbi:MAG TPA: phage portal protein, partial [Burkholderiaceae bacterium]|nr:phage portal protein [Burkholderiaceae bacterium]